MKYESFEIIDDAKTSCAIGINILNDLLLFDKTDQEKIVLEKEEVYMKYFLFDFFGPFLRRRLNDQIEISLQIDKNVDDVIIKLDRFKIEQVMRNFLMNAIKFVSNVNGRIIIRVKFYTTELQPDFSGGSLDFIEHEVVILGNLRVEFEDNGIGITKVRLKL